MPSGIVTADRGASRRQTAHHDCGNSPVALMVSESDCRYRERFLCRFRAAVRLLAETSIQSTPNPMKTNIISSPFPNLRGRALCFPADAAPRVETRMVDHSPKNQQIAKRHRCNRFQRWAGILAFAGLAFPLTSEAGKRPESRSLGHSTHPSRRSRRTWTAVGGLSPSIVLAPQ